MVRESTNETFTWRPSNDHVVSTAGNTVVNRAVSSRELTWRRENVEIECPHRWCGMVAIDDLHTYLLACAPSILFQLFAVSQVIGLFEVIWKVPRLVPDSVERR